MREKREIHNDEGRIENIMIDPEDTIQHIYNEVEWVVSADQWRRIKKMSRGYGGKWYTEKGAEILFESPVARTSKPGLCN